MEEPIKQPAPWPECRKMHFHESNFKIFWGGHAPRPTRHSGSLGLSLYIKWLLATFLKDATAEIFHITPASKLNYDSPGAVCEAFSLVQLKVGFVFILIDRMAFPCLYSALVCE